MYIYEIGSLTYFHRNNEIEKGLVWRNELDIFAKELGIKTFNPGLTYLKERNHQYDDRMCVDQNEFYINKCDIAVANMDAIDYSPGSIYELVRFKTLIKPVIAFGERHWSPHLNSCISNYCKDLEEVKELLMNMFDQSFKLG